MGRHYVVTIKTPQAMRGLIHAIGLPQIEKEALIRLNEPKGPSTVYGDYLLTDALADVIDGLKQSGTRGILNGLIGPSLSYRAVNDTEAYQLLRESTAVSDRSPDEEDGDEPEPFSLAAKDVFLPAAHQGNPSVLEAVKDIRIGHFDTGQTKHPVFGYPSRTAANNAGWIEFALGLNYVETEKLPLDPWPDSVPYPGTPGHGTRTGSIITGHLVKPGIDPVALFTGVAPQARLVPYRLNQSTILLELVENVALDLAIHDAITKDCQVLSLSMGSPFQLKAATEVAIDAAYEAGVIFVCAAGNVVKEVVWPAKYNRTLAIGGSCVGTLLPWPGASRGPLVDVSAPADKVMRANWQGAGPDPLAVPVYSANAGTSYSTAMVAGAAALWLAKFKDDLGNYPGWRRVELFRHLLKTTATTPRDWPTGTYGAGILNVAALLNKFPAEWPAPDTLIIRQSATLDDGSLNPPPIS